MSGLVEYAQPVAIGFTTRDDVPFQGACLE
jgi:hypothetical protein